MSMEKKKTKPLQLKRGTAKAFRIQNPILLEGQPAVELDTHKLKIGDGFNHYNSLPYIGDHLGEIPKDGKSAYQIWRESGYEGTIEDFLASLVGEPGKSTYEIWLSLGNEGTIVDFIESIQGGKGDKGDSAYELWIKDGNEGTISDFLGSLVGKSAYDIWLSLGNKGTQQEFINSLKGDSAYEIWKKKGFEGTENDFLGSLKGESAFEIWKNKFGNEESTEEDFISFLTTISWGSF